MRRLEQAASSEQPPFGGNTFRRLLADRDIRPERADKVLNLRPDGTGATNVIRRYVVTSNPRYPRDLVQQDLLNALNTIFGPDGHFTELQVQVHDDGASTAEAELWEVYLCESAKGLIPLSHSGSGLKTVILVLLNLLVEPHLKGVSKSNCVFAFEELENNLHPALLRRLLQFVLDYAVREHAHIFLTTHSNAALDLFGQSADAQIVHVTHDGKSARTTTVAAHFDRQGVISELGARPSDLLQANGIIWVEGPSDRIYVNRWLELHSDGRLKEGKDYQCAFYGGGLLARAQFAAPEEVDERFANLLRVNPNVVVICDSDRQSAAGSLKARVRRVRDEVRKVPLAHCWVTSAREIENYLTGAVVAKATGQKNLPDPGQFESFFPKERAPTSYAHDRISRTAIDKVVLASACAPHIDRASMVGRFDLSDEIARIADLIDSWNR